MTEPPSGPTTPPESDAAHPTHGPQATRPWTREIMLKEGVTAFLGIVIVLFTIVMAWRTMDAAGNKTANDSKEILQITLALAGVVVGYYFGRVPGDVRAVQAQSDMVQAQNDMVEAQQDARRATARSRDTAVKAEEMVGQMDLMLAGGEISRVGDVDGPGMRHLRELQAELRGMQRSDPAP